MIVLEPMPLLMKPLIGGLAALSIFSVAPRSLADVVVPLNQALVQIEGTQVPILIPSVVPNVSETYVRGRGTIEGYVLDFSFTPTCDGTVCHYAWISAERDGKLLYSQINRGDTIASVQLAQGIQGQFVNTCGAYCLAQVEWQSQGVLYRSGIKNGRKEVVIALANSAILGGERRNASATRPVVQNDTARKCQRLTHGWLTSEDRSTPINVRDNASTDSYARHIGYAGDEVAVLNQKLGSGYCWYQVRFPSQATGWVRGDFLTIDTGE